MRRSSIDLFSLAVRDTLAGQICYLAFAKIRHKIASSVGTLISALGKALQSSAAAMNKFPAVMELGWDGERDGDMVGWGWG